MVNRSAPSSNLVPLLTLPPPASLDLSQSCIQSQASYKKNTNKFYLHYGQNKFESVVALAIHIARIKTVGQ